jgi:GNAT superfamily N-acetyltransferase
MKLQNVKHRRASQADLLELLSWLKADQSEHGDGFWPNRYTIGVGVEKGDLYVATHHGEVVGFQLGETNVDLIQVRWRHRRKGIGSLLLKHVLHRAAKADNAWCFAGALDEGFWLKQGFSEFVGDPMGGRILMALHVPTWSRQLAPAGGPQAVLPGSR